MPLLFCERTNISIINHDKHISHKISITGAYIHLFPFKQFSPKCYVNTPPNCFSFIRIHTEPELEEPVFFSYKAVFITSVKMKIWNPFTANTRWFIFQKLYYLFCLLTTKSTHFLLILWTNSVLLWNKRLPHHCMIFCAASSNINKISKLSLTYKDWLSNIIHFHISNEIKLFSQNSLFFLA